MKVRNYLIVLITMILVGISVLRSDTTVEEPVVTPKEKIKVALVENEGFSVTSENPVEIVPGEKVQFNIKPAENYVFKETEGVEYVDGTLIFDNITTNRTLYLELEYHYTITLAEPQHGTVELLGADKVPAGTKSSVKIVPEENYEIASISLNGDVYPPVSGENFEFIVEQDCEIAVEFIGKPMTLMCMSNNLGTVIIENSSDEYRYGDQVCFTYDLPENIYFNGWSIEGYLGDGGILVSEEEKYEYTIEQDTVLYANFMDTDMHYIMLDGNGGEISGVADLQYNPNTYVNLPVDNGEISREGYTLIGYNTEADGSGEDYRLGEMLIMPDKNLKLYAEWKKHTEAEYLDYSVQNGVVTIHGFAEAAPKLTELCIPKEINGSPVVAISQGAFQGEITLELVILPVGTEKIGKNAFGNCTSLTTVYLPETLTEMAEDAFAGDTEFAHLRILASLPRVYDLNYDAIVADKYMRLKSTEGKRIILVGGSNLTFGLDSVMLKEQFSDYDVVNFSGSHHNGIVTLFELLKANVHEGDVIIFCPEYDYRMYGSIEAPQITNWQYIESNYAILDDVDIRNTPVLFSRYPIYLASKREILPGKLKVADSVYVRSGINIYGDMILPRSHRVGEVRTLPDMGILTTTGMNRYNEQCKILTEKGATCLFSFPSTHGGEEVKAEIEASTQPFLEKLASMLDPQYCTIISKCVDYTFEVELFYDHMYHLTLEGAKERTKQLIKDLQAFGLR